MSKYALSQSATAKLLGVSESTFSRYLTGTYPNPETIERKITDLLDKAERRLTVASVEDIPYALTSIALQVEQTLDYARLKHNISVIHGDAGIGKTYALEQWSAGKTDIIKLTAAPAIANPKAFFKYLARELKVDRGGHIDDLYIELIDRLTGSDKVIAIDEAQHLTLKTLENLRGLQEAAQVALVLIGNEQIYSKMIGRQRIEFAQLFSRIAWKRHLLTDQFGLDDVQKVFGDLESGAEGVLLDVCRSKYGLRGATHVYVNASNNGDISAKGLRAMAKTMGIYL
ncbi:AAA family ATPase [Mycobacterium gordonae]|nr:AAA family ATPase [Mycobacterium gordonae]